MLYEIVISLITLTVLEIVLGIDNIIFLSLRVSSLAKNKQVVARNFGLLLAMFCRIILLAGINYMTGLNKPFITILNFSISFSSVIFLGGGIFLISKSTIEIHNEIEKKSDNLYKTQPVNLGMVIFQIVIMDMVFSLDSIMTAIGMTRYFWVMVAAIVISIFIMLFTSKLVISFIGKYLSIKILALSFLILIGFNLIAAGMQLHIPKWYLYLAMGFIVFIEVINIARGLFKTR